MFDWIINQIKLINIPTLTVSVLVNMAVKELWDLFKRRNLQAQQAKMQAELQQQKANIEHEMKSIQQDMQSTLDKEIEKHKYQLQVEFIKVEIKTKQLSIVYPELFVEFKHAEKMICWLCSKKQKKELITPEEIAGTTSAIHKAVSVMVINLLFVSKEVEKGSDDLMSLMHNFEKIIADDSADSVKNIQLYKQTLRDLTDSLQLQMKKELGTEVKGS